MDYIIFDLEWNRVSKKVKFSCPDEIIQIGAVKYDSKLNFVGSFNSLIKPVLYNRLEPMVQNITGITMESLLKDGVAFCDAFEGFREFMGKDFVLMSWGVQDATILRDNCLYHKASEGLDFLSKFADLQSFVAEDKRIKSEQNQPGLKNSVVSLGIEYDEETLHNALVDATLSGEVFVKTFNKKRFEKYIFDARNIQAHSNGIHITDFKSKLVDKKEFLIRCPKCGRFISKTAGWYRRGKSFFALFKCRACRKEMMSQVEVLLMPDGSVKYKKRINIIEKADKRKG